MRSLKVVEELPRCIPISSALQNFTGVETNSCEQYKDLRPSSETDNEDIRVFIQWPEAYSPFSSKRPEALVFLASRVIENTIVNCDEAVRAGKEAIEKKIHASENFLFVKPHRKGKVKSLSAMKNSLTVRVEYVVVNPSLFFNQITCILNTGS